MDEVGAGVQFSPFSEFGYVPLLPKHGMCGHFYSAPMPLVVWAIVSSVMHKHTVLGVYVVGGIGTVLMPHFGTI